MIDSKLIERLKVINTELAAIEKRIVQTAIRLDSNLQKELAGNVDGIRDYEMKVEIQCYGSDETGYPLFTMNERLNGISSEPKIYTHHFADGDNNNEFRFREEHPMKGEHHCWLYHCLYSHIGATLDEIASIQHIYFDIIPRYEYCVDTPSNVFISPVLPARHVLTSHNYNMYIEDVFRDIYPDPIKKTHPIINAYHRGRITISAYKEMLRMDIKIMSDNELEVFHSPTYLASLRHDKSVIEGITQFSIPPLITAYMINENLIDAARAMCRGTVHAAQLALKSGWAINLGGGFHRAHRDRGENMNFFNDYAIATHHLRQNNPDIKILYIDLDALCGDGVISFAKEMDNFYVLDLHNTFTKFDEEYLLKTDKHFTLIGLKSYTGDELYLQLLYEYLPNLINEVKPDIIFYNAGGNVLKDDPFGHLCISQKGLIKRDLFVFREAQKRTIPIMMCISRLRGLESSKYIERSLNLVIKFMKRKNT